jgi:hypothetical protein
METFSISLPAVDKILSAFGTKGFSKAQIDLIGSEVVKVHQFIERRVTDEYATGKKLTSVLTGGLSIRNPSRFGKTYLEFGLEYKGKRLPLAQFISSQVNDPNHNRGRFRAPQAGISINKAGLVKRKQPNKMFYVSVRRGKPKLVHGLRGQKAFLLGKFPKQLGTRMTEETWSDEPNVRAPYWQMETLSLSEMAYNVTNDTRYSAQIDVMTNKIADIIQGAFSV